MKTIDNNLVLSINYYDIYLSGKFKLEEIMFKLHGIKLDREL